MQDRNGLVLKIRRCWYLLDDIIIEPSFTMLTVFACPRVRFVTFDFCLDAMSPVKSILWNLELVPLLFSIVETVPDAPWAPEANRQPAVQRRSNGAVECTVGPPSFYTCL